ncbi:MAG: nuclear transport factor 2 family protein [Dysgonomonas sp.]|nr:nuclear transport factor 2 family protein [Dysgonomonas sp.]
MNKLIVISIFCFLSFGFVTKSVAQSISPNQTEVIKKQVDAVFLKMVDSAKKFDFKELSSGVDDTHMAGFISNGKYYASYSALVKEVEPSAQGIDRQDISFKDKKITVLSESLVLVTTSGVSNSYLDDGREIIVDFQWSFIYEKINNDWKVIHSHQSSMRVK